MATIKFTNALRRFFPTLSETELEAATLSEVLTKLESQHPGLRNYIVDEQGALRKHVNIFIDGDLIHDRESLSDSFGEQSEIYIMQALSGG